MDLFIVATPRPCRFLSNASEADERFAEQTLRDLRGRVQAARAAISRTPAAEDVLLRDWVTAAKFYARFGIAETMFRRGVAVIDPEVETS